MPDPALLILGGTSLAIKLAKAVEDLPPSFPLRSVYSLAGRTFPKSLPKMEVRIGGFGGKEALADYLRAETISAVIDATHAYAAQISINARAACEETGVPHLRLQTPPWKPEQGDNWIDVPDLPSAREEAARSAHRVLVSTGRQSAGEFISDNRCWWLLRMIAPEGVGTQELSPKLTHGDYIYGRGPFDLIGERALLRHHKIDGIISKNAGNSSTYAKIIVARELSIPVIMIKRPHPLKGPGVETVAEAIRWLKTL